MPFEENLSDLVNTLIDQLTYTPILWLIISSGLYVFIYSLENKENGIPTLYLYCICIPMPDCTSDFFYTVPLQFT